jgi:hypothetical protein
MVAGVSAGPRIFSRRRGASPSLVYKDTTEFRAGGIPIQSIARHAP